MKLSALPVLLLLLLAGCAPDFIEPWQVRKPRHLAARVEIDGDTESRSRPRPGESFSLRMTLMTPGPAPARYTGMLSSCLGALLPNGTLACVQEVPLPSGLDSTSSTSSNELVFANLPVPEELAQLPAELDQLNLVGAVCVDGRVERVPGKSAQDDAISELFRCVDNEGVTYPRPLPFTMTLWLDRGLPRQMNRSPSFACDESLQSGPCHEGISDDGELVPGPFVLQLPEELAGDGSRTRAWQAWDAALPLPWDDCASAPESLPRVRVGEEEYTIRVRFDASDRESYQRVVERNGVPSEEMRREDLLVSHALTAFGGRLERYESVVYYDTPDDEAEIEVDYRPPRKNVPLAEQVPPQGRLVRFYFALRDLRGGVDVTTRELCLLPSAD